MRYAYDGGGARREVLHGVDLTVRPGERLAVVGPSGAGKSTLGRLLAGIDAPRTGSVTVGRGAGRRAGPASAAPAGRPRHPGAPRLPRHGPGQPADRRARRRRTPSCGRRWPPSAPSWARELPDGLDTELGAGGHRTDGSQAQQLALARVVLADPHTLILDEATALLDPTTARHTERALAAVLEGPYRHRHRAPAAHRPRRGPGGRDGGRPAHRTRHPRRAGGGGRRVRRAVAFVARRGRTPASCHGAEAAGAADRRRTDPDSVIGGRPGRGRAERARAAITDVRLPNTDFRTTDGFRPTSLTRS